MARPISTASINTLLVELIQAGQLEKATLLLANHRFPSLATTNALSELATEMVQQPRLSGKEILKLTRQLIVVGKADLHTRHEKILRYAARSRNTSVIQYLLVQGADINVNEGETLQTAVRNNHISLVKYLIRKGVSVNSHKSMAMRIAVENRNTEIIRILLDAGAKDTALVTRYYLSPEEKTAFADFFVTFCASVEESDEEQLAILKGALIHAEIVQDDDIQNLEYIKQGTKKQLCNWMKIQVFTQGTNCQSKVDPLTQLPVAQIPLIYLWTTKNIQTGKKMCFDILELYRYIEHSKFQSPNVPILVASLTPEQIAQVDKVYVARLRLFWHIRNVLKV